MAMTLAPRSHEPLGALNTTPQGAITWNGKQVGEPALVALFQTATAQNPQPLIRFESAAEAPYAVTLRVLNIAKATGPAAFALSGNGRYATFTRQD